MNDEQSCNVANVGNASVLQNLLFKADLVGDIVSSNSNHFRYCLFNIGETYRCHLESL